MDIYIGLILPFAGNYAPYGFLPCDGRLLQVSQYTPLFAVIGNTYGGDGQTNFALPDLRGRVIVGINQGGAPGISNYNLAQKGGAETATLSANEVPLPPHTHTISAASTTATQPTAAGNYLATVNGNTGGHSSIYSDCERLCQWSQQQPCGIGI